MSDKQEQSQAQEKIPLESSEGELIGVAVKTGNNAAWMCICGYNMPLIWAKFPPNSKKPTICNECGKKYRGVAVGKYNPGKIVKE